MKANLKNGYGISFNEWVLDKRIKKLNEAEKLPGNSNGTSLVVSDGLFLLEFTVISATVEYSSPSLSKT